MAVIYDDQKQNSENKRKKGQKSLDVHAINLLKKLPVADRIYKHLYANNERVSYGCKRFNTTYAIL